MDARKLAVFDMDGTLLDTLADLADSCNHVLEKNGFPTHPEQGYKAFIGKGAEHLILSALSPWKGEASRVQEILGEFRAHYQEHSRIKTKPYDDIPQVLQGLRDRGIGVGILSNKPHEATGELADFYFSGLVDLAWGLRDNVPSKPNPQSLLQMIEILGSTPQDCVYIGDSTVDIATARNAGVKAISVTWGFCTKDELMVENPTCMVDKVEDLLEILVDNFAPAGYTN